MAQPERSIFNEKAAGKLRSPDDLDKYVRVTNPSMWAILIACIALLAGLFAWAFFGSVSTSVGATGVSIDGKAMCFLTADDAAKVGEGDIANVAGEQMKVESVGTVPSSREEAEELLQSDFLVETLMEGDWAYLVTFDRPVRESDDGMPLEITITVESMAPINLVFGKA
ncbi:MAG: hypothetical protein ACOYIP_03025 [Coriobacteriales bacterium]|jgi:hypothetical protein